MYVVHHLHQVHNRARLIASEIAVVSKVSYSIPEAVEASSLSRSTIFDLIKSGELASTKVRGRRLIPAAALHQLVAVSSGEHSGRAA